MLRVLGKIVPRTAPTRCLGSEKPKVPKQKISKEEIMKKKTPAGKLDEMKPYEDPYLKKHPGGVNPVTGEKRAADSKNRLESAFYALQHMYKPSQKANSTNNPFLIGGPAGPEPTRYGDWERKGRVSDF